MKKISLLLVGVLLYFLVSKRNWITLWKVVVWGR